jgi:hypothetical protein
MSYAPAGYWKLDETSGTTAVDSSGNARNGTYTGSGYVLADARGPDGANYPTFGSGGNSSHVAIADADVWSLPNPTTLGGLTVFALVRPTSVAGTTRQFVASKGTSPNSYEWAMYGNSSSAARFEAAVYQQDGAGLMVDRVDSILTTAWQVCAFRVPTSSGMGTRLQLFRNGALTETQGSITGSGYTNSTSPVWIGWRADSPASQYWVGAIAHAAIFGDIGDGAMLNLIDAARRDRWI